MIIRKRIICEKCGFTYSPEYQYCPNCGTKTVRTRAEAEKLQVASNLKSEYVKNEPLFEGMIRCKKCGNAYHKSFNKCPQCGKPRESAGRKILIVIFIIVVLAFIVYFGSMMLGLNIPGLDSNDVSSNSNTSQNNTSNGTSPNTDNKGTTANRHAKYTEYDFKTIARNPDNYVGQKIVVTGIVITVWDDSNSDYTIVLIIQDGSDILSLQYWGAYYLIEKGKDRILAGDHVIVYGQFVDCLETPSEMGLGATMLRLIVDEYTILKD